MFRPYRLSSDKPLKFYKKILHTGTYFYANNSDKWKTHEWNAGGFDVILDSKIVKPFRQVK